MKKIHDLVMQASYILGLICLACGIGVRVLWHFGRALTYVHQSWFIVAGVFFLCALATDRISRMGSN